MQPHPPGHPRRGRLLLEVPLALLLAVLGVYLVLRSEFGDGGVAILADHEVLVRIDNLSGELSADDRPGAHTFIPWFEQVYELDRRTRRYVMGAGGPEPDRRVTGLVVRGRDGANFAFGQVELQVALDPVHADLALVDHGADPEFMLRLVDAYARPVLRGAFGRYAPREIVLPENKQDGTENALAELSKVLGRHGIRVLELSVSKPQFAPKYQETIDRRKVAEQDTERLERERVELLATADERARTVRDIEERKLVELRRDLEEKERVTEREMVELRTAADRKAEDVRVAATLVRDESIARATVVEDRHRADAAAFGERLAVVESQGELAVRAALVERLGSITFNLVPWAEDDEELAKHAATGGTQ
jgi:hypothetical protein